MKLIDINPANPTSLFFILVTVSILLYDENPINYSAHLWWWIYFC
jgi:hypothetical protein